MTEPIRPDGQGQLDEVKRLWEVENTLVFNDLISEEPGILIGYARSKNDQLWHELSAPFKFYAEFFDAKVADFNRDRERIIREKDFQAVLNFAISVGEILDRRRSA